MNLAKFSETHTLQSGIEGLKILMKNELTDNERMIMLLNKLTDFNEHVKA